jgi:S-adenosylmethionine:tRNA ribosyltransferase-isomerase
MKAATEPRAYREMARLLIIDRVRCTFRDSQTVFLPEAMNPGDLLVVNDAATLPGAMSGHTTSGAPVELRLVQYRGGADWDAVLMGSGNWRVPTEFRDAPEIVRDGEVLEISDSFFARVVEWNAASNRCVILRFSRDGAAMWAGIYAYGRPIQYSYLNADLALWSVQTAYASRPWAAEMPSAGYPINWGTLLELRRRGIGIAYLTHAAGLSSIGDASLDAQLPFPERYDIPRATVDAIARTHEGGGRVIAVGTTVVRAIEGSFVQNNGLIAGEGMTNLVVDESFSLKIVDGILTGMHDPDQSHFRLLSAFVDNALLRRAWLHAEDAGYLCHEFGDLCLIL